MRERREAAGLGGGEGQTEAGDGDGEIAPADLARVGFVGQALDLQVDDLVELLAAERVEQDDVVDPVQELGPERRPPGPEPADMGVAKCVPRLTFLTSYLTRPTRC